jgi:hypothetical protein
MHFAGIVAPPHTLPDEELEEALDADELVEEDDAAELLDEAEEDVDDELAPEEVVVDELLPVVVVVVAESPVPPPLSAISHATQHPERGNAASASAHARIRTPPGSPPRRR